MVTTVTVTIWGPASVCEAQMSVSMTTASMTAFFPILMHLFGLYTKCVHVFSFKCTLFCIPLHHEAINLMSKELFKRIDSVIRSERLYANVNLMREDVIVRFGISRHRLNDLLNQYAGGLSFPQYINNMRVEEAHELIVCHQEMSIAQIAFEVGFTPPNLRDQFKRRYGMTPMKYRTHLE